MAFLSPGATATLAKRRLSYFTYHPPVGGHGGDFDELVAICPYDDAAGLARLLGVLGYSGPVPPEDANASLGMLRVAGAELSASVVARSPDAASLPHRCVVLSFTAYVSEELIEQARGCEAWLLAQGIAPLPSQPRRR